MMNTDVFSLFLLFIISYSHHVHQISYKCWHNYNYIFMADVDPEGYNETITGELIMAISSISTPQPTLPVATSNLTNVRSRTDDGDGDIDTAGAADVDTSRLLDVKA
jgi:hypothetical protein